MLNNIKLLGLTQKTALQVFKHPYPLFRFSQASSNIKNENSTKKGSTTEQSTSKSKESVESNKYYYPIKRINFTKKDIFPIYTTSEKQEIGLPGAFSFFTSYSFFFAYGISYIFFFDIYNYWHMLPLTYFLIRGSRAFFRDLQISGTIVRSVFLKKDGKTLIVTVPMSPVYYKYKEDIDLSEFPLQNEDIKLTVDLDKVARIGFLEVLRKDGKQEEGYITIKSKKQEKAEQELTETLVDKGEIASADAELETQNIMILIERGENLLPLYIDLEKNTNKSYNDYLIALAQKKKIIMRETKDEA